MKKSVGFTVLFLLLVTVRAQAHPVHPPPPTNAFSNVPLNVSKLAKFVDPLPIPSTAVASFTNNGVPVYEMPMLETYQWLHRDIPATPLFAYWGEYPGPTFEVEANQPISVQWINQLPEKYPSWLPVNTNLHGATNNDIRTVVHLHGGRTPPQFDGHPEAWIKTGQWTQFDYPNLSESGATLWYHDHAAGLTRLNVYSGMAGFYIVRNKVLEQSLNLPKGKFEIPLLFQDRKFTEDGRLLYSEICHEAAVVNGKVWPYLDVEPRKYRFRMLNGCNFRTLRFAMSTGQPFIQIGTEAAFLAAPAGVTNLLLGPGERADVIVDFASQAGKSIVLSNTTSCFGPDRDGKLPVNPEDTLLVELMQLRVAPSNSTPDLSVIPPVLVPVKSKSEMVAAAAKTRTITLDQYAGFLMLINQKHFSEPVEENPRLGMTEIWNFVNLTEDAHPLHIHLIDFRVLDRTPFKPGGVELFQADRGKGTLRPLDFYLDTNAVVSVPANQDGPKDTAIVPIGGVLRLVMEWKGFTGDYVYHCHILDHEDHDMMRPLRVLGPLGIEQNFANKTVGISFPTEKGYTYRLDGSSNLKDWTTITNVIGFQGMFNMTRPAGTDQPQLFRVRRTP